MSKNHYNEDYFNWQKYDGIFGALANKIKFDSLIKDNYKVLDFGCGGGFFLGGYKNIEKFGVEINPSAYESCKLNNLTIYKNSKEIPKEFFDLIISNNALEHIEDPLTELKNLYQGLKKGGKICIVVPCDNITNKFRKNDPDFHLFSFSPLNLGNILTAANFKLLESKPFINKWPPYHKTIQKLVGWKLFNLICKIYGRVSTKWWQVRAIAEKDSDHDYMTGKKNDLSLERIKNNTKRS